MNSAWKVVRLFLSHSWRYPGYVVGLLAGMPVTVLLHQFLPQLILAHVLAQLSSGRFRPHDLWGSFGSEILLYMVVFFAGNVVAWRSIVAVLWRLESLVTRDIDQRVFAHLLRMSTNFHANHFGGSLVAQANRLTNAYMLFIDTTIVNTYQLLLVILFTVIILTPRAPLFVVVLLGLSLPYVVTAVLTRKRIRTLNKERAAAQSRQTGYLADAITNVLAIKSFAAYDIERHRFNQAIDDTHHKTMDTMRATVTRDTVFSTISVFTATGALTFAAAGVVLFHADVTTVFLIFTYTTNLLRTLWIFNTGALRSYDRVFGDAADMVEILALTPEVQDPAHPKRARSNRGEIVFHHVTFQHPDAGEVLFTDFNLHIKPGEKVGLVGRSGSGKTTLTKLLLRFVDIDAGKITIDGQNITHITQEDLRRHIAYVPQEPLLFHRTIRENIAYGKPDASDQKVEVAAHKAHAAEFIKKLPHSYDTLVGERGVKLSGGQRQRIAIARAILKDAPVLVLDEATSALDSESEHLIQGALGELMKKRTSIVIAHRLSTVQKMDRIIVLEDGAIVEQGTHSELLAKKGYYARLWAHQSGGFFEE